MGEVNVNEIKTLNGYPLADTKARADIATLTEEIDELKENGGNGGSDERLDKIASFFDLSEPQMSSNLLNPDTLVKGYYLTNQGVIKENAQYVYTDYIEVNAGDDITLQYTHTSGARNKNIIRWVSAYDASKNILKNLGAENVDKTSAYTVPEGVAYVRLSASILTESMADWTDWAVVKSFDVVPYEPYGVIGTEPHLLPSAYTHIKNGYSVAVGAEWTAAEENHDVCGYTMIYKANLPNGLTGSISVGKGYNGYQGGYITVNPTTMTFYTGEEPKVSKTQEHGLTIKDYIAVRITLDYSANAKVRIATNGGVFDTTMSWAGVRKGAFFVADSAAESTDGRFAYSCSGWGAKTHMYGDSYFGVHNESRWPYYLVQDGHTDVLINGHSGRKSAGALAVLKSVLAHSARPERIIWTMGMNDPDATESPNTSWLSCVEQLKKICKDNAIELILATVPLVASVDNAYKNAYVKGSGYRYIDFAAAVGASSDTAWFDGMLHSDGVHPDVQGAAALYFQAIADVPELMD